MLEALNDWNIWWKAKKVAESLVGKERKPLSQIEEFLKFREIKLITGVRRSGKSTFFYQIINHLLEKGVKPEKILLINFEDDVLSRKTMKEIFDVYQSSISSGEDLYIFLDEIHRCGEWELFVRKFYDTKKFKQIFITDSSSKFISEEYASIFTGRNLKFILYPLSFKEYVLWNGVNASVGKLSSSGINEVKRLLKEYLEYGGFPEIFFKEKALKNMLLKEYLDDIIYKDIVERFDIDLHKAKELALFLLSNISRPFSIRNYARQKGLSFETIEKYLTCFEEVFLIFKVAKFDYSIKSQQLSPKKIYVVDQGLSNVSGFKFSEDIGSLYENTVFIELKRRLPKLGEIYYWKSEKQEEVDFLIKEGLKVSELIQVCYSLKDEHTKEREVRALLSAMNEFKLKKGTIITQDYESMEKKDNKEIKYIPLWKWLIKETDVYSEKHKFW